MTTTVSEHEYLRERIGIIHAQVGDFEPPETSHATLALWASDGDDAATQHRRRLCRELCLLGYLQQRAIEGDVLRVAEEWRRSLGVRLYDHRQKYLQEQDACDRWWHLPPPLRALTPEPPRPPELWLTDRDGHHWLINDRMLIVLDNIIRKLKKWCSSA
ncbi:MAG: hypothetical protein HZB53_17775 [Chloroflexi bacterium]|nr:hypothetical protein [Chloroflexota bacterium]